MKIGIANQLPLLASKMTRLWIGTLELPEFLYILSDRFCCFRGNRPITATSRTENPLGRHNYAAFYDIAVGLRWSAA